MAIDFGLASRPDPNAYLGPLQAMAAGRQAALETRRAAARQAALGMAARGDLEGAQNTALAGGDTDTADYIRSAQARAAAGQVISQYGPQGGSSFGSPVTAAPAAPQSPVQSLISAGTPGAPAAPRLASGGVLPAATPPASLPTAAGIDPLAPLPDAAAPAAPQSPMADHTHEATVAIGKAAATGQPVDPTQAWAHLYSLDPAMGDKMMAAVGTMDKLRVTRLAETTDALANAAQSLAQVPVDQRAAQLQHLAPVLAQHGVTPDMLANADLSDNGLAGIIGQSIGVKGMLDQANKEVDQGFDAARISETHRSNVANEGLRGTEIANTAEQQRFERTKPISAGFGTTLVRPDGTVVYDGSGGGGGSSGGTPWTSTQLADAVPFGGKVTSTTRTAAHNAEIGGAPNSQHVRGTAIDVVFPKGTTVAQVQAHYASLGAPVKVIHEGAGDKYSTGDHFHIQAAPGAGRSGGGSNPIVEAQARAIADGRMPPLVGRAAVSGLGGAVMRRALEINPQLDGTTFATDKAGRVKFTSGKTGDTIRSLDVAVTHLDQLQTLADALHNGNTPLFNRIGQALAQSTGSAVPTNFDSVKQFVTDEVTKAVIGSGGGVGDREHAAAILSRVQSPAQLAGAIYQIKGLMAGQLHGLGQQYKNATHRDDFATLVSPHTAQVLRLHAPSGGGGGRPADISAIMAKYGAR